MKKQIRLSSDKLKNIIIESVIKYLNEGGDKFDMYYGKPETPWDDDIPEVEQTVKATITLTANIDISSTAYIFDESPNDHTFDYYKQIEKETLDAIGLDMSADNKVDYLGIKWEVDDFEVEPVK